MMFKYVKWHNNYPFKMGKKYAGYQYNEKWVCIENQLYRTDCFEKVS